MPRLLRLAMVTTATGLLGAAPPADTHDPVAASIASVSPAQIRQTIDALVAFGTRNTLSAQDDPQRGIGAARRYLLESFARCAGRSNGRMTVSEDPFSVPKSDGLPRATTLVNVVATLPGDEGGAGRVYVISGHYDSRNSDGRDAVGDAPGADDDASGTAAVLAAACALAPYHFPATLVFLAVAGEEQGLFGSRHWAQQAKETHTRIGGMVTNDIVGTAAYANGPDGRRLRLFAEGSSPETTPTATDLRRMVTGGENDSPARTLARYVRTMGAHYVPALPVDIVYRRDRYLRSGDHLPFLEAGYAAIRLTEPRENFARQHQTVRTENGTRFGDLAEYVDPEFVADVARVNIAAIATLALAPATPSEVSIVTERLENDTTLRWKAVPGATGYRVFVRRTTAPDWEETIDIGVGTSHTLVGRSKDDFIFGLAAVGAGGYSSLPAYPLPSTD